MASRGKSKPDSKSTAAVCYKLALPQAESLGLILWDVRFIKEGPIWYLRIFIDKADGYVSIDDCTAMSRRMDKILERADPIPHAYCLEVCSPGIDRELVRPEHFKRFEGCAVSVRLYSPFENKREFIGDLVGYENDFVIIRTDNNEQMIFSKKDISAVNLVDDWDDFTEGETDNE